MIENFSRFCLKSLGVSKRSLGWVVAISAIIGITPAISFAVSGSCAGCHTMHDSQNGTDDLSNDATANTTGAQGNLLTQNCVGCHTLATGNTQDTVDLSLSTEAPYVDQSTTVPTFQTGAASTLAGGSFYWVGEGAFGDSYGHNVEGVDAMDVALDYDPPGFDIAAGFMPDGTNGRNNEILAWSDQLTCAGVNGCHGYATDSGVTGAHHNNNAIGTITTAASADNVGDHYRFLEGIKGVEEAEWEFNVAATPLAVNVYHGNDRDAGNSIADTTKDTISFLCAECHGDFHSDDGGAGVSTTGASPWIRHPIDIALADKASEYANYADYDYTVPVAFDTGNAAYDTPGEITAAGVVQTGLATVTCLSCHVAHGGPYPDLLRWDYTAIVAGSDYNLGCNVCHNTK